MAYERRHHALLPKREFIWRVLRHAGLGALLIALSLGIGVVGYHRFFKLPWVDSLLNASMILGGMGPVDPATTTGAKLFASAYALFSGVTFLTMVAIILSPILHRFLHRFHLDGEDRPAPAPRPKQPGGRIKRGFRA